MNNIVTCNILIFFPLVVEIYLSNLNLFNLFTIKDLFIDLFSSALNVSIVSHL